ncbi:MAG: choice-of-anchor J domain-containing protein, partial [Verrucomicrobia bacterium]|nr:choice-of-anchor J domain-containing protein [Verrucomicrobiota bacterium]
NGENPGNYDFKWGSKLGSLYDLVSSTDLSTPIGTWPVWEGHADIAGTAPTNTLPDVPGGGPTRFFAVIEKDPPPLLGENFDAGPGVPGGWTAADNAAVTAWEVGDPSTGPAEGPDAAVSGAHCAGTNIVANYTAGADATLTSPAIEVPAGGATLSFQQYIDTDGSGDVGAVRLLDATPKSSTGPSRSHRSRASRTAGPGSHSRFRPRRLARPSRSSSSSSAMAIRRFSAASTSMTWR